MSEDNTMSSIMKELKEVETLELIYQQLIIKRDGLIDELNERSSNLPILIAKNQEISIVKAQNQLYLNTFNSEYSKLQDQQNNLVNKIKTQNIGKAQSLLLVDKYQKIAKETGYSQASMINIILQDIVNEKMATVDIST